MGLKQKLVQAGILTGNQSDESADTGAGSSIPISTRSARAGDSPQASAVVDTEYVNKLREILNSANIGGVRELLDQMKVFESVPGMDEATRMRAAFASLGNSSKIRKGDILKAGQARLDLLAQKKEEFSRQIETRRSEEIGGKTAERQQTVAKIDELRRQITELETRVSTLDAETQTEENHLARALSSFNAAYAVVEAEERTLVQKINQNLN